MLRSAFALLVATVLGCGTSPAPETPAAIAPVAVTLVESEPVETNLDRPDIVDAADVWLEMVNQAKRTLDFGQFYASEAEPAFLSASKLTPIIDAIVRAHERGVKVRFLVDEKFAPRYPQVLDRFAKAGIEVRRIKGDTLYGGVQHAKYFVVDGFASFIGSQNLDWRALDQIQEMGVRLYSAEIAGLLLDVFETDWELAGGAPPTTRIHRTATKRELPGLEAKTVEFVASPFRWLPDEGAWDLPRMVDLLDRAQTSIDVQVLKYKTQERSGQPFTILDDALRRAAARGVKVRLLVSEWAMQDKSSLRALQNLANVAKIRVIVIPKWSGGEIPFARVAHAKYLVTDDRNAWVGTSNWESDYFTKSRNVGVILRGGEAPARLGRFFEENWASKLVIPLPLP